MYTIPSSGLAGQPSAQRWWASVTTNRGASARHRSLHIIPAVAHLAPVEKPAEVAAILLSEVHS